MGKERERQILRVVMIPKDPSVEWLAGIFLLATVLTHLLRIEVRG